MKKFEYNPSNSYQHLSSQYIEQIVEIEMKRLKVNCSQEEENYVEQMLLENPIIVERRKTPTPPSQSLPPATQTSSATNCKNVTNNYGSSNTQNVPDSLQSTAVNGSGNDEETVIQLQQQQQQQRSESCRRSRINNKIKKAKAKYRHKFMSEKLLQSANVLECLQKLIEQTENQLINQGFNALQLLELRKLFYNNFTAAE
ncbi:protein sisterless A-like [Cochliomyia hominivorax]